MLDRTLRRAAPTISRKLPRNLPESSPPPLSSGRGIDKRSGEKGRMIKVIGECLVKIFPVLFTLLLANDFSIKISRVVTGYRIKLFLNIFRENIGSKSWKIVD